MDVIIDRRGEVLQKIKVLVVATSVYIHKQIVGLIAEDSAIEVIGVARNSPEAVYMVHELRPDVVVLNIEIPEMKSIVALTSIMTQRPMPILTLSSLDGVSATITALLNGAVDFITTPTGLDAHDLSGVKDELILKIKQAAQIPLRNLILNNITLSKVDAGGKEKTQVTLNRDFDQIVAIGTSTGGPKALEIVLAALPASFPYPLLIVQHMPPTYTQALADRLNRFAGVKVVEAEDNQIVLGGTVYLAPGDYHMTVIQSGKEFRIQLDQKPLVYGQRPSVDVLFDSISELKTLKRHFILMTGNGSDGAKGMLTAKQAGVETTIVESKETSIAYEMPGAAVELGCVDYQVPLYLITSKILEVTGEMRR